MPETLSQRKERVAITEEKLQVAINMIASKAKAKEVASAIGISVKAAYRLMQRVHDCAQNGITPAIKRCGPKVRNLMSASSRAVVDIVQQDCTLTQKGIAQKLSDIGVTMTQSSVSRVLKKNDITRKRLVKKSEKVLSPKVISLRKVYAAELRTIQNYKLLYLDETGFNLHSCAHYGYSPKNVEAVAMVPANRGRNISLLSIISTTGIIAYDILEGPYNSESFIKFLENAVNSGITFSQKILVMDNVKFHHSNIVKSWLSDNNVVAKYLPPYSPQLNPIEEVFSVVKARYHEIRPLPRSVKDVRENICKVIADMNASDTLDFEAFYSHMRKYLDIAFQGGFF